MAISTAPDNDKVLLPPLYVIAYSKDGLRHDTLIEDGERGPDWFAGALNLNVTAPSGITGGGVVKNASPRSAYKQCAALIGEDSFWAPEARGELPPRNVGLEIWTSSEDVDVTTESTLLVVSPRLASRSPTAGKAASPLDCPFIAVVRQSNGTAIHVCTDRPFYVDVERNVPDGSLYIPRALIDTGLAGAFWGFVEHDNKQASSLVAARLLHDVLIQDQYPRDLLTVAAMAHAILTHRDLLSDYGLVVVKALESLKRSPDSALLKALLSMALLSKGIGTQEETMLQIREAIKILAHERPIFGETVRWLDAKFDVLSSLLKRRDGGRDLDDDLDRVVVMLRSSFVGGQLAAYMGEPPIDETAGWHRVDQKKKPDLLVRHIRSRKHPKSVETAHKQQEPSTHTSKWLPRSTEGTVDLRHYDVILEPRVTEKSTALSGDNKVVFNVAKMATKPEIRAAVEAIFRVKVTEVNTLIVKGKQKTFRGRRGKQKDQKRAIVTLRQGDSIDMSSPSPPRLEMADLGVIRDSTEAFTLNPRKDYRVVEINRRWSEFGARFDCIQGRRWRLLPHTVWGRRRSIFDTVGCRQGRYSGIGKEILTWAS